MVTVPPLISAEAVNGLLPGGLSVTQAQVDAMASALRHECGWHIAPVVEETVILDSEGNATLRLPTGLMTALTSVTNTRTGEPIPVDLQTGWSKHGIITTSNSTFIPGRSWTSSVRPGSGGFPSGFRAVTVTFSHGYEECPLDLARYLTQTFRQRIISETLVGRSVTFDKVEDIFAGASILDKYRLGGIT